MIFTPGSFGTLKEANPCHEPGGSEKGGQFAPKKSCSSDGAKWYGGKHPRDLTANEFVKLHNTGFIASDAYENYEKPGGMAWLGPPEKYPILAMTIADKSGKTYEVRMSGKKQKYTKLDVNEDIVRDKDGLAMYLSDEEVLAKGYPLYEPDMTLFDKKVAVGNVSNEWGAIGLWVERAYQKKGLGAQLLAEYMRRNPKRRAGQMTHAGVEAVRAAHRILARESLREANPCHNPEDGRFAVKGQGRCLGVDARRAARVAYEQGPGPFASKVSGPTRNYAQTLRGKNFADFKKYAELDGREIVKFRRDKAEKLTGRGLRRAWKDLPGYMQQDAKDAWAADRAAVVPGEDLGLAAHEQRIAKVRVDHPGKDSVQAGREQNVYGKVLGRDERLTVLRHELGHLDRTPFGSGARKIGKLPVPSARYGEELRAWKNAIRNGKGRVDFEFMRSALFTYLHADYETYEHEASDPTLRDMARHRHSASLDLGTMKRIEKYGAVNAATVNIDAHVKVLKRYAQRIKHAVRQERRRA